MDVHFLAAKLVTMVAALLPVPAVALAAAPSPRPVAVVPLAAPLARIPTNCSVYFATVTPTKGMAYDAVLNGSLQRTEPTDGPLPFTPVAVAEINPRDGFMDRRTLLMTDPRGRLLMVDTWLDPATMVNGQFVTVVATSGWAGVKAMAASVYRPSPTKAVFYAQVGNTVHRYRLDLAGTKTKAVRTASITMRGMSATTSMIGGRFLGTAGAHVDALLGVNRGKLMEWRIPYRSPAKATSVVLQASGWAPTTQLATGSCWKGITLQNRTASRLLAAMDTQRSVRVWLDANRSDASGKDLRALGVVGTALPGRSWAGFLS